MRVRGVRRLELSPVVLATYNHNNHKAITPPKSLYLPLAVRDWGGLVRVCTSRATVSLGMKMTNCPAVQDQRAVSEDEQPWIVRRWFPASLPD
ncbi:hypothetical protein CDV36_002170 [Fusarium kuroshium]|uniref:Uncharacterized protein n=1 Tax=Fusarium kuroshium TaxID=2010991 RepID=A0A3M2SKX1_9HYPO|nr:hypothetical protein CDV36_002170 [Fusarium kuroshium]